MTNANPRLRLATKADAVAVAALSRQTFYETFAADNTKENMDKFLAESFSEQKLVAEVGLAGNDFLVIDDGDQLLGYAKISQSPVPPELGLVKAIEIVRIYVLKTAIGQGLGKLLMEGCLELARQYGQDLIWLGVWEHNQPAIEFYSKWGFEHFGEHVFILGDDVQTDWLMKKSL